MGQSKIKVQLIDSLSNDGVEFAAVSLTKSGETQIFKFDQSDSTGVAEIADVPNGKYILKVSHLNYEGMSKEIEVAQKNVDLGKIYIKEKLTSLGAVTVTGTAIPIVVKKDTIEFSASAFKVGDGDVLSQLLKKLPGMEIDKNGKVTYNGKAISKILVDGEDFFSKESKLLTGSLPANIINKVKVIDRKSDQARFTGIDDGQEETIMDVTVKEGFKKGLFGNATAGYGTEDTYNGNLFAASFKDKTRFGITASSSNISDGGVFSNGDAVVVVMGNGNQGKSTFSNYGINANTDLKGGKLKISGNFNHSESDNDSQTKRIRQTFMEDSSFIYNQIETGKSKSRTNSINGNIDWNPTKKIGISFMPNLSISNSSSSNNSEYTTNGASGIPINKGSSSNYSDGTNKSLSSAILFRYQFDKKRRTFSMMTNFGLSNGDNDGYNQSTTTKYADNIEDTDTIRQKSVTSSDNKSLSLRASYTEPLSSKLTLEMAYSLRYNNSFSDKETYNWNPLTKNYDKKDDIYSNDFKNINLGQSYDINIQRTELKYNYQIGFSLQPTYTKSEGSKRDYTNNVTNYAPTLMFNYTINKSTFLRFNYRGMSSQPSIDQMQPVPDNSNPLYIRIGNPNLIPGFRNNITMSFRKGNYEKFSSMDMAISAGYNTNIISNISAYGDGGIQYTAPINTDPTYNGSVRLSFNTPLVGKKLFMNMSNSVNFNNNLSYTAKIAIDPQTEKGNLSIDNFKNISKNITNTLFYRNGLGINLNLEKIDFSLMSNISYRNSWYSIASKNNAEMWNYNVSADVNLSLPYGFSIRPNASFFVSNGYGDEKDKPYTILNGEIEKSFSKSKFSIRIKMSDILNQAKGVSRTTTDNYVEDQEYMIQKRYFLFSLSYQFGKFPNARRGTRSISVGEGDGFFGGGFFGGFFGGGFFH